MPVWSAEALALVCLAAVLAFAVIRPRGLPEGVAAVPVTALVVARTPGLDSVPPPPPDR